MTKLQLLKWANQEKQRQEDERRRKEEAIQKEINGHLFEVQKNFEKKFKDLIPALKEAGINYRAQMKMPPYAHQGFRIKFTKDRLKDVPKFEGGGLSVCYMDIWKDGQHRLSESQVFGNWAEDKPAFSLWLCNNLGIRHEEYEEEFSEWINDVEDNAH